MISYEENPFIVIWEVTRACALNCLHCRAEAQYRRDPRELSTEEGKALLRQIQGMGSPLFVFTGGDPLMREDFFELAAYAKEIGLRVSMTPSATPRVTEEAMRRAKDIGFDRWAISLDGSTAEIHDRFRGTAGSHALTVRCMENLQKLGMPLQVNTTVSRYNKDDLANIADIVGRMGAVLWSVFFLVPTGRGKLDDMLSPGEHEEVFRWLAELSDKVPFDIKTTAAPHYRRVMSMSGKPPRRRIVGVPGAPWGLEATNATGNMGIQSHDEPKGAFGIRGDQPAVDAETGPASGGFTAPRPDTISRAPRGVNDGNGFLFISHIGDVYPSGFLPVRCGNVREQPIAAIYRDHPTFRMLRDPDQLKGKCGVCEFRRICGGSRARAYAVSGDMLASDPSCAYIPAGWQGDGATL